MMASSPSKTLCMLLRSGAPGRPVVYHSTLLPSPADSRPGYKTTSAQPLPARWSASMFWPAASRT
jgi:hypothetical protein